jgi:hypothetical protein
MGRSRKRALPILMERICELRDNHRCSRAEAITDERLVSWTVITGTPPDHVLQVEFIDMMHTHHGQQIRLSTYFCVWSQGVRVMTGHLYDDQRHHVMSWKRGDWQAALFPVSR